MRTEACCIAKSFSFSAEFDSELIAFAATAALCIVQYETAVLTMGRQ